jgi:hypothetical protein
LTDVYAVHPADREFIQARLEALDRPGSHLWVAVAGWHLANPRSGELLLDRENLVTIQGPGCLKCEQPFSNRLARKPCRGSIDKEA